MASMTSLTPISIIQTEQYNMSEANKSEADVSEAVSRVGNYRIGKVIGRGTFATVHQAIHEPTQQMVSIKIMNKCCLKDYSDQLNYSREVNILSQLRHPNIAQLLETFQTVSHMFLVLQKAQGGELYEAIVNQPLHKMQESTAIHYFMQLIDAVDYLHFLGIAHRDIKPENLMISNQSLLLIDFGLSNYYRGKERLFTACGSPCYAAPEMLSDSSYDPYLADLWSCGVVLYTMLCGCLPYESHSTNELYRLIINTAYEEPAYLSSEAKALLKGILQIKPQLRTTSGIIRRSSLCRAVEGSCGGLLPSEKIELDAAIVERMRQMGLKGFKRDIETHKNCSENATYFLLLKKSLETQQKSLRSHYLQITRKKTARGQLVEGQNPEEKRVRSKKKECVR